MRFLFATLPATGHLHPTLPVAERLRRSGHEVVYTSSGRMASTVEGLGFGFVSDDPEPGGPRLSEDFMRVVGDRGGPRHLKALFDEIVEGLPAATRRSLAILERVNPDAVLADTLALGKVMAVEKAGLPWASSSEFPGMIPHPRYPPYLGLGLGPSDALANRLTWRLLLSATRTFLRPVDRAINRVREEFGLPRLRDPLASAGVSPYLYLAYTLEEMEYGRREWPAQVHLVGPCLWDGAERFEAPPWLESLAEPGPPLIYATMGTVQSRRGESFFRAVAAAVADRPLRAVITTGDLGALPGPPNVRIVPYVPQSLVLPHAALAIHHGGFSTTLGALAHGVPSIAVPVYADQHENARRAAAAGLARRMRHRLLSPAALRRAAERVLGDAAMRARVLSMRDRIAGMDGPDRAARLLVTLARTRAPVLRDGGAPQAPPSF